jgi:hypothetical protein
LAHHTQSAPAWRTASAGCSLYMYQKACHSRPNGTLPAPFAAGAVAPAPAGAVAPAPVRAVAPAPAGAVAPAPVRAVAPVREVAPGPDGFAAAVTSFLVPK